MEERVRDLSLATDRFKCDSALFCAYNLAINLIFAVFEIQLIHIKRTVSSFSV